MYGLTLILILALMGGAIAFIGDRLGTKVGKKRISVFGMRPKHTSILFTVISGILIVTVTLGVMAAASKDVRTALFGMEKLKVELASLAQDTQVKSRELDQARDALKNKAQEVALLDNSIAETRQRLADVADELETVMAERDRISLELADASQRYEEAQAKLGHAEAAVTKLEANKKELEADLKRLEETAEQLRKGLVTVREGQVIYRAGEVVAHNVLPGGKTLAESKRILNSFLLAANDNIINRLKVENKELMVLWVAQRDYDQAAAALAAAKTDQVVRVVASGNIVYGEPVISELQLYPNRLVYKKGTVLHEERLEAGADKRSEGTIMLFLAKVNERAVKDGVLADPLAGTVGSVRAVDVVEAVQAAEREKGPVKLTITAKYDIYTIGPLEVALRVSAAE